MVFFDRDLWYYIWMMDEHSSPAIRHEELFASEDNPTLNYFYASNKILPSASLLGDFFRDFNEYST